MGKQPLTKPMIDQFSKEAKKAEAQATNLRTMITTSLFRYLGCRSFEEVDQMTMSEFELRMIAFNLAEVDEERKRHELT